jgi:hypothetical protein
MRPAQAIGRDAAGKHLLDQSSNGIVPTFPAPLLKNFLTCVKLAQPRAAFLVGRRKVMNVQRLNPLLPSGGNHLLSSLLASALMLEASVPGDMEARLTGLARPVHRGRNAAAQ